MNRSEVPTTPRFKFEFVFPEIEVTLQEKQYRNLIEMLERFSLYHKSLKVTTILELLIIHRIENIDLRAVPKSPRGSGGCMRVRCGRGYF
jgi:hypothetical protein